MPITVTTPSRLCLFGEHLDYHSLEVITMAIDLYFKAEISTRRDGRVIIQIKDESIDTLNQKNDNDIYETYVFDLTKKLLYENSRDYFKSCFNVIKKRGYDISCGFNIKMDSDIPIGKGMCSSSAMIVVLIKAVLEAIDADIKDNRKEIAQMGYEAEVTEFNEPGGKMDHMASAFGGICMFDFADIKNPKMKKLKELPTGGFILFDSLQRKNTIKVLETARKPVEKAMKIIGVRGIKQTDIETLGKSNLIEELKIPAMAALYNYAILKEFVEANKNGTIEPGYFGEMLYRHHCHLRDGLKISTRAIEEILDTAMEKGALGGKLNGTGGGGCCYVFAHEKDMQKIKEAVEKLGYPGRIVRSAKGVNLESGGVK